MTSGSIGSEVTQGRKGDVFRGVTGHQSSSGQVTAALAPPRKACAPLVQVVPATANSVTCNSGVLSCSSLASCTGRCLKVWIDPCFSRVPQGVCSSAHTFPWATIPLEVTCCGTNVTTATGALRCTCSGGPI